MFGFSLRYYLDSFSRLLWNFSDTVWIVGAHGQAIRNNPFFLFSKWYWKHRTIFFFNYLTYLIWAIVGRILEHILANSIFSKFIPYKKRNFDTLFLKNDVCTYVEYIFVYISWHGDNYLMHPEWFLYHAYILVNWVPLLNSSNFSTLWCTL